MPRFFQAVLIAFISFFSIPPPSQAQSSAARNQETGDASISATLPDSFFVETLAGSTTISTPTALSFAPGGNVFIAERSGKVWHWEEDALAPELLLDLSDEVYSHGQLGLLSLAVSPDFQNTPHLFLLYSIANASDEVEAGASIRLVRYELDRSTTGYTASDRDVLLGNSFAQGIPACAVDNAAGALAFMPDGTLLVATADGADPARIDAGDVTPSCFGNNGFDDAEDMGAFRAQSLTSLAGKILRLDPETGLAPQNNPFFSGNGNEAISKVWAYGLRHPKGLASIQALNRSDDTNLLIVGDRGQIQVEELNLIPSGGRNLGWPCMEGPGINADYTSLPQATTYCEAEDTILPTFWWHHQNPFFSHPKGLGGNQILAGALYEGNAYPEKYKGRFFYADFNRGWLASAQLDPNEGLIDQEVFSLNFASLSDLKYNPYDGRLYFTDPTRNTVSRLRHLREIKPIELSAVDWPDAFAGNGLYSVYYNGDAFSGNRKVSIDSVLAFDGNENERFEDEGEDGYSVRWEAFLHPPGDNQHSFFLRGRGAAKLWLNDSLVVTHNAASPQAKEHRVDVWLSTNQYYKVRVEYSTPLEDDDGVVLEWQSPTLAREVVPTEKLHFAYREGINLCQTTGVSMVASSVFAGIADATRACDANIDGNYANASVAVTNIEPNPFWEVDLGRIRDVAEIRLWGRTDCCEEALEDAFVLLSDTPFQSTSLSVLSQPGVSAYRIQQAPDPDYTVKTNRTAQYIRIQQAGETALHLAEVEIIAGLGNEAGAPPVDGLIAWWPFDLDGADRRGGYDGTLKNGADIVFDPDRKYVVEFDGSNDLVEIPHRDALNGTLALTYAAWVKPETWEDGTVLISKMEKKGGQMALSIDDGRLIGRIASDDVEAEVTAPLPPTQTWTHLALVFSGDALKLHINGVEQDTEQFASHSMALSKEDLIIGTGPDNKDGHFNGRMDDVMIYQRALSGSEIVQLQEALIGVSNEEDPATPLFEVASLYPNPSSETVSIGFNLHAPIAGRIVIYDVTGRQIRVLADQHFAAIRQKLMWDGNNESGHRVSAGIYFLRFESAQFVKTFKLVRR